jgi:hypothetical protein
MPSWAYASPLIRSRAAIAIRTGVHFFICPPLPVGAMF